MVKTYVEGYGVARTESEVMYTIVWENVSIFMDTEPQFTGEKHIYKESNFLPLI